MRRRTERLLWGAAVFFIVIAIVMVRGGADIRAASAPVQSREAGVMMFDPTRFETLAEQTASRDPFRLERKPSDVSFGTPDPPPTPPTPPATPFQSLVLKGITGGPPWMAIFAGVPNRSDNVVARVGDTLAGLRVTRVRRDGVVLRGRDTLLTLTLTRTWQ